jgi:hypothetical protein
MKKYFLTLIIITLFACSQKVESLEEQFACETDTKIYFNHLKYEEAEFIIYHPRNWKLEITENEPYTSYVFSDTIPELSDQELGELSDEEFKNRYNEFTSLTLTQDKIYQGFNYKEGWTSISKLIESNDDFQIVEIGKAKFNGKMIQWIKYKDNSYLKDSLINLTLATCLIGESNYITIQACVFGEKEIEKRMCELIDVINTITVE